MARDRFAPPDEQALQAYTRSQALVSAFRAVDPALPTSYVACFLAVAQEPGMGVSHYAEKLDMLRPVVSRILLEIGKRARTGGMGMGLVDSLHGSSDLRAVNYFLTPKGEKLAARVQAIMESN